MPKKREKAAAKANTTAEAEKSTVPKAAGAKKKSAAKTNALIYLMAIVILLGGVGVFMYPTISNYFAEKNQVAAVATYDENLKKQSDAEIAAEMEKARIYNENLAGDPVHDPFVPGSGYALPGNYEEILNVDGNGMMGYIEIPKIAVKIPIYHTSTEEVLQKGVGHIESTALPIGGSGTHAVLTGHRGLPSAELFTRLDELEIGDCFYIHVLNEIHAYKICEVNVVLPTELENLVAEPGKDFITLVTCTPYGVNTHRMLVKGERTEYNAEQAAQEKETYKYSKLKAFISKYRYYLIGIAIAGGIGLIIFIISLIKKIKDKKDKKQQAKENEAARGKENTNGEKNEKGKSAKKKIGKKRQR